MKSKGVTFKGKSKLKTCIVIVLLIFTRFLLMRQFNWQHSVEGKKKEHKRPKKYFLTSPKAVDNLRKAIADWFLRNKVMINDFWLFEDLLNKLSIKRLRLLQQVLKYLEKFKNCLCSAEVYETSSDLNDLYFVISFPAEIPPEKIDKEIFNLYEYKRKLDKDNLLWFIHFVGETENRNV
jgi:hypothetical protein